MWQVVRPVAGRTAASNPRPRCEGELPWSHPRLDEKTGSKPKKPRRSMSFSSTRSTLVPATVMRTGCELRVHEVRSAVEEKVPGCIALHQLIEEAVHLIGGFCRDVWAEDRGVEGLGGQVRAPSH